jgi:NDP-sugar pyrophosphorylase family protein
MNIQPILTENLFSDRSKTLAAELVFNTKYPFEALLKIKEQFYKIVSCLDMEKFERVGESVYISKSAKVNKNAFIGDFTIIDEGAEIRQCAYIRGSAIIGKGCVVGNSSEIKNSILFDKAQVPHFNYVGDSILGYGVHLGAGAITSNLKSDRTNVKIAVGQAKIDTGLRKMGAIIGDLCEIGCNTVLNPGTVIGRETTVYPLSIVRGYVPCSSIFKTPTNIVKKK